MYELEYVKKRKRRRRVAIAGFISASVITSLSIIAFLGRFVGTFTVSLETRNVNITLLEKQQSTEYSSFLRINSIAPYQEFTYSDFSRYGDAVIDSEDSSYELGANNDEEGTINFLKYTFYVKNVGKLPAKYDFKVNIENSIPSEDGRFLDDTLRVMIYENGKKTIYGKAEGKPRIKDDGTPDYRPPISVSEYDATEANPFMGYVDDTFVSSEVVTTFPSDTLNIDEARRYTIVTWIEGFRSDSKKPAPKGATIKLGVEINAYENE